MSEENRSDSSSGVEVSSSWRNPAWCWSRTCDSLQGRWESHNHFTPVLRTGQVIIRAGSQTMVHVPQVAQYFYTGGDPVSCSWIQMLDVFEVPVVVLPLCTVWLCPINTAAVRSEWPSAVFDHSSYWEREEGCEHSTGNQKPNNETSDYWRGTSAFSTCDPFLIFTSVPDAVCSAPAVVFSSRYETFMFCGE